MQQSWDFNPGFKSARSLIIFLYRYTVWGSPEESDYVFYTLVFINQGEIISP